MVLPMVKYLSLKKVPKDTVTPTRQTQLKSILSLQLKKKPWEPSGNEGNEVRYIRIQPHCRGASAGTGPSTRQLSRISSSEVSSPRLFQNSVLRKFFPESAGTGPSFHTLDHHGLPLSATQGLSSCISRKEWIPQPVSHPKSTGMEKWKNSITLL